MLIHALPAKVGTVLHPTLMNHLNNQRIVEKLKFTPLTAEVVIESPTVLSRVQLHSPDLTEARAGSAGDQRTWRVEMSGVSRYCVLECLA